MGTDAKPSAAGCASRMGRVWRGRPAILNRVGTAVYGRTWVVIWSLFVCYHHASDTVTCESLAVGSDDFSSSLLLLWRNQADAMDPPLRNLVRIVLSTCKCSKLPKSPKLMYQCQNSTFGNILGWRQILFGLLWSAGPLGIGDSPTSSVKIQDCIMVFFSQMSDI